MLFAITIMFKKRRGQTSWPVFLSRSANSFVVFFKCIFTGGLSFLCFCFVFFKCKFSFQCERHSYQMACSASSASVWSWAHSTWLAHWWVTQVTKEVAHFKTRDLVSQTALHQFSGEENVWIKRCIAALCVISQQETV